MAAKKNKSEMSFLDHLEVLRWHLMRSVIAILVGAVLIFVNRVFVMDQILLAPTKSDFHTYRWFCEFSGWLSGLLPDIVNKDALCFSELKITLLNTKLQGKFYAAMIVSFVGGIILAFPYIFWETWRFIKPALHNNESKKARGLVFFGTILFATGISFGYFMISPLAIHFLATFEIAAGIAEMIDMNSIMGTIASSTLACGVIFELPVVTYYLAKIGLISSTFMKKYRKHSFVVTLILSAIITPPDVFSQVLVAIPIVVLYELSIIIAKRMEKKRELDA
jgi:sec-independent protein translocase protein TatC